MREFLVFRLYGPMCSWGDIAMGGFRPSVSSPSRSAIVGLLAAALGIRREQEDKLSSLNKSVGLAFEIESYGNLLTDYQTAQAPRSTSGNSFFSRKREIDAVKVDTKAQATLSHREYYTDSLCRAYVWSKSDCDNQLLMSLCNALKRPRFPLYLGRKSCPPSLPLAPQILKVETLRKAIQEASFSNDETLNGLSQHSSRGIYWDDFDDSGLEPDHVIIRRDDPLSRLPWAFADRYISYCVLRNEIGE